MTFYCHMAVVPLLGCLTFCASLHAEPGQELTATANDNSSRDEFIAAALKPFWRTSRMREPLFFIQKDSDTLPTASLLFRPNRILSVVSADRETIFEAGKDFSFDAKSNSMRLPAGSRIPFTTIAQLYPLMTSDAPKIGRMDGKKVRGVFFDNESRYHRLQVEVTYDCEPRQWKGKLPKFAGNRLPRTIKKLRDKRPIRLLLCGDSISAGYNASKFTGASPGCPSYGELVALALAKHYGTRVHFSNYAINGWDASRGSQQAVDEQLGEEKPDLVIIAYGMNDVFSRDAASFQKNIQKLMDSISKSSPETEFLLVASMLGNAEWGMPMEQFPLYHDALKELCGPGVVLADLLSTWQEFLKHKSFYDLTGNGVNHPNDFGHIVYAQTLLSLLVETSD